MKPLCPTLAAAMVALFLLTSPGSAQEWTRFRGPNGSGINDRAALPPVWSEQNVLWNKELPAGGHSSPVLWGQKLFVTCADDQSGQRTLLCLSAVDGSQLWKQQSDARTYPHHTDNSYASSTPAVDADAVYTAWVTPEAFVLEAHGLDGKPLWNCNLGPFISQHGGGNSPIIAGDLILIADDQEGPASFLFGVDRKTGKVRWKAPRRTAKFSGSTPVLLDQTAEHPLAVFCSQAEGVTAVDPLDGRAVWSAGDVFDSRTISSPVVGGGLVVATCGEGAGGHVLVGVKPPVGTEQKASVELRIKDATPYVPTPLIKGDLLFYLSDAGKLTCWSLSASKVLWQHRFEASFFSSPVGDGPHLFCVSKKGVVFAVNASDRFELLGTSDLGLHERCHATPAIADGCFFLRSYTHVVCISAGKRVAVAK